MNIENKIAQNLLQIKAIKLSPQNPFTWASGMRSPIYCDNRVTLSHPEIRNTITEGFVELSKSFGTIDAISGVATAGIAHGALLAQSLGLPFSYVRSSAKAHGRQNQIEGEIVPGSRILVIEDLISTGGSAIQAIKVLKEAGYEIAGVMAIFTYGFQEANENFITIGSRYETLSNYGVLLQEAKALEYITEAEEKVLQNWNSDPRNWHTNLEN